MPNYSVRKVKTFIGQEGQGFNAELLKDGKPIAFVIDDAHGGPLNVQWNDVTTRVQVTSPNGYAYRATAEEAALLDYVKDMVYPPDPNLHLDKPLPMGIDGFIDSLVQTFLNQKTFKRLMKTKTLFRLKEQKKGKYYTINSVFSADVKAHLVATYGDTIENIYNENPDYPI